jgi:F-type H+-transporting ATPase subunit b
MDELLRQLENLMIGALPTLILFVVLVLAYRFVLYGALMNVRAERRRRTVGAVEASHQAIAAADARTQEYEAKLRAARADILRQREQRIQQRSAEKDNALAAARVAAQQRVHEAQAALEAQTADARRQIEITSGQLAAQVLAAVLPPAAAEGAR